MLRKVINLYDKNLNEKEPDISLKYSSIINYQQKL